MSDALFYDENAALVERLTFTLQAAEIGTWDYNLETGFAEWSSICKELFGLPADAAVTPAILLDRVHSDDREMVNRANKKAISPDTDGDHNIIFRTRVSNGRYRWVQAKGRTYKSDSGTVQRFAGIVQDVSSSIEARHQLQASEERFRTLIEEAPVATCLFVGRDLVIDVANNIMIGFWGKGRSVLGKPAAEAVPELMGQPFLQILDEVFTSGQTYESQNTPAQLPVNGVMGTYYFDFTYKPLRNAQGEVYAILEMAVDVTGQVLSRQALEASEARYRALSEELESRVHQRTQEVLQINQDLKRSNENLQQFAYIASHDLQEPLRKIQSFSTLLNDQFGDELGDGGRDLLHRMSAAGARMSTLIKDLLTYSRIATRQQVFGLVSLDKIMANVLTTLDWEIQQREARIDVDELPIIKGDESQLGQLFQNLLSNALKFTPGDKTPQIQIQCLKRAVNDLPADIQPTGQSSVFCQISVSDQGVGFDTKYLDRIFQVFQRLHAKNEFPGTGVGLAICQRVVENHGGAITATSKPGEGATFCVYLPA